MCTELPHKNLCGKIVDVCAGVSHNPRMNIASTIIGRLGGTRKVARGLDKPPSTVQGWKDSGFIPAKHQPDVLALAQKFGVKLSPADFFPAQPGRTKAA